MRNTLPPMLRAALSLLVVAAAAGAQDKPASVALNSPQCVRVPEARGEQPGDEELGVGRSGEYCAYPLRMMAYHRVVNDHLGGPPILVSYDPETGAGRVFDPALEGKIYTFDAAPPQRGLPVLKDRETGSVWSALTGEALSGPLAGTRLARIPSLILTWERWKSLHSDSWVLAEDPTLSPHYTTRATAAVCPLPGSAADLAQKTDNRLKPEALVVGISEGGHQTAFPLTDKQGRYPARPRAMEIAGLDSDQLVLFSDPGARAAAVYRPEAKQQHLTFAAQENAGTPQWVDHQTGSTWNLEGACVAGPLKGEALAPASFMRVRWYAWSATYPKTAIIRGRSSR
jgi:uncharacterized protein DUF3179